MSSETMGFLGVVLTLLVVMLLYSLYLFWMVWQEKRKTFTPLQRRNAIRDRGSVNCYVSSGSVMSLWQSDGSIFNAPPSYEDVDEPPPRYEEVIRIHNPVLQNHQPTLPPIAESLALSASQQPTNPQINDIETNNSVSRAHAETGDKHFCTLKEVFNMN